MKRTWKRRGNGVEFPCNFAATRDARAERKTSMVAQQLVFLPFRLDLDNEQLWEGEMLAPLRPKLFGGSVT